MNSSVGPKPMRIVPSSERPLSTGLALTSTPLLWSRLERASVLAKAGTSVEKRPYVLAFLPGG